MTIHEGHVRVLQIEPYLSSVDRALEKVPDVVDKLSALFQKEEKEKAPENAGQPGKASPDTP